MAEARSLVHEGGNHICYAAERDAVSVEFLDGFARRGRARGQQVVWLIDAERRGALARLVDGWNRTGDGPAGGDGAALGNAVVRTAEEVYLDGGKFDPDRTIERYHAGVAASRRAGHTGLRVIADTSWLIERPSMFDRMLEYEQRVNNLFAEGGFAAVCHYERRRVPARWLRAMAEVHPISADDRSSTSVSVGSCRVKQASARELRLTGEIDFSNAGTMRAVLSDLAPETGDLHLDLSALDFVDVAGTRAFVQTAGELRKGGRLVLFGGPRSLSVVLEASGWADTLERVSPSAEGGGR